MRPGRGTSDHGRGEARVTTGSSLTDEAARTGALIVAEPRDPMAELVRVQRLAAVTALAKGLDPDNPPLLARSVVLQSGTASRRVP